MRLFVSEYLCSGAWPEPELPPSLACEGRAMLLALLADMAELPGVTVCTTWDARLGQFPRGVHEPRGLSPWQDCGPSEIPLLPREKRRSLESYGPGERVGVRGAATASPIACTIIHSPDDESAAFHSLAAESDATYIIAPELDDVLTRCVQSAADAGGRCLNASPDAITACSDKWDTFRRLSSADVPTVPTAQFDPTSDVIPFQYPVVLKPRFGAGSQDTFLVRNQDELRAVAGRFPSDRPTTAAIVQPYIDGRSISVAAIFRSNGTLRELWPIGEQHLSNDGRFSYLGGRIPLPEPRGLSPWPSTDAERFISDFGFRISDLISGLCGYVGIDLIFPPTTDAPPLIVDINPRLTTSYLGYRALTDENLAARILWPDHDAPPVRWHDHQVIFNANGEVARSSSSRG